jgi:DNA-binding NtrC family response regulator
VETPEIINVLIVDDDERFFDIAQHLFSRYQGRRFNLLWKQHGTTALEELERNKDIHIVLIDYYLPEVNGLDVTKKIREKNIDVPIIFLTSNRDFRLAIEVMKYGVEDYLVKDEAVDSVLPRTVVNVLERILLKKRIAEQQRAELIAQRRSEAMKEVVVTVCHEFNNPLAAVKISADIISRHELSESERDHLKRIDKNLSLIDKEITKLRDLNFEKIEYSKV